MADLTSAEAAKVRLYLGYDRRDLDLVPYLTGLSAEEYVQVQALLASLDDIDSKMTSSVQTAGVYERAEEITFRGSEGQGMLGSQGNALVRRLARFLGVEVRRSPFASGFATGPIQRG